MHSRAALNRSPRVIYIAIVYNRSIRLEGRERRAHARGIFRSTRSLTDAPMCRNREREKDVWVFPLWRRCAVAFQLWEGEG